MDVSLGDLPRDLDRAADPGVGSALGHVRDSSCRGRCAGSPAPSQGGSAVLRGSQQLANQMFYLAPLPP